MNFDEFTQYVKDNIKDFLPKEFADADVAIREVVKNNDEKLCGLHDDLRRHRTPEHKDPAAARLIKDLLVSRRIHEQKDGDLCS